MYLLSILLFTFVYLLSFNSVIEENRDRYGRCEQVPDMRSCLSSGAMEQGSS